MAHVRERHWKRRTSYQVRWRDDDGRGNSRTFDAPEPAQEFAASIPDRARARGRRRGPKPIDVRVRIERMSVVDPETGCWVWRGRPTNVGYGQMTVRTQDGMRTISAHRVSYETFVGPIPDGLVIDHLCRVRLCVNPVHLEPVTMRENTMRSPIAIGATNAAKTHCPQGHAYDEENTVWQIHRNGTTRGRLCRQCQRDRSRQSVSS